MTASITSRLMAVHLDLDPRDPHVRCIGDAVIVQKDRMDADVYTLNAEGGISHQHVAGDAYAMLEHLDPAGEREVRTAEQVCLYGPDMLMGWDTFRWAVYGLYCEDYFRTHEDGMAPACFSEFLSNDYLDYDAMHDLFSLPGHSLYFECWEDDPEVLLADWDVYMETRTWED